MRILHVSLGLPPFRTGGLTKYSYDLMRTQLEKEHQVYLLYPGRYIIRRNTTIREEKNHQGIQVFEIINPLPVSLLGGVKHPALWIKPVQLEVYLSFLQDINPDVIHLHTLMGIHRELIEAARALNIRVVFTSHDYYGICPRVNLIDATGNLCDNYLHGIGCVSCNQEAYSMTMIYLMQSKVYRFFKNSEGIKAIRKKIKKRMHSDKAANGRMSDPTRSFNRHQAAQYVNLRMYYLGMLKLIDWFHFNSTIAEQEYKKYGEWNGQVIPIQHRDIQDRRCIRYFEHTDKPLRIAYLGPVDRYKGFFLLHQSLEQLRLQGEMNWILHVYGDSSDDADTYDSSRYIFHGRYQYHELQQIFDQVDIVVVPSIWKETFGFIGLEAMSFGVPVLVTDQVGCKDLIQNRINGLIVLPDIYELTNRLREVIHSREILREINQNLVCMDLRFSMYEHVEQLMKGYTGLEVGVVK
ncbi:glycosyltransferase [Paenibacillus guangzhouensis]|uniref:glycosyltransferase n=1 Tax=Paenibacillus guangzhouensis TaxID=1473112 RepID=UPI001267822D|nr:glycosyltransferase [Paenibacillus guangzhouensis]